MDLAAVREDGFDNFRCDFGLTVIAAKSLHPNIIG